MFLTDYTISKSTANGGLGVLFPLTVSHYIFTLSSTYRLQAKQIASLRRQKF